jgi:hypothetical protein
MKGHHMRKNFQTAFFLIGIACGAASFASQVTLAQEKAVQPPPPPSPAWLDTQGKLSVKLAPKEMAVVGPDGKLVKGADGRVKMVPSLFNELPPPPPRRNSGEPKRK